MEKYVSLARKYRPQRFSDMVGQGVAQKILQNSIVTKLIHHAYIFSGTRGTGKTTAARIFAKSLNCLSGPAPEPCDACENCTSISKGNFMDVIEMDAGSQTSVEDIRTIKEMALYPPMKGRYKVFIVDEAHMLSLSAFNALLKIFEEPPEFDIFILATTEPHKIPETVQSRAIRVDFTKIPKADIVVRLKEICSREGIQCDERALELIAEEADGSMRDAISILESMWMYTGKGRISEQDVQNVFGIAPSSVIHKLLKHSIMGDTKSICETIDGIIEKGYNIRRICKAYSEGIKDICLHLDFSAPISEELREIIRETGVSLEHAMLIANSILRLENDLKFSLSEEVALKMFFLKICYLKRIKPLKEIISEIRKHRKEEHETQRKKETFELLLEYLELSGKYVLLEKLKNTEWESKNDSLVIKTDDAKVVNYLTENRREIERFMSERIGRTITVRFVQPEKKLDIEKIFGDEIEEIEGQDTSPMA